MIEIHLGGTQKDEVQVWKLKVDFVDLYAYILDAI